MSPPNPPREIEAAWTRARAAPLDPQPWASLFEACLSHRDLDGAQEALAHLEAMSLGDTALWRTLALQLEAAEQWPQAYRAWRRVVDESPNDPDAYRHLAQALSRAGELGLALVMLETALRLDPEDAETHRMLARGHLARGQSERARHHASRAAAIDPDHPSMSGLEDVLGDLSPDGPPPPPVD